jgi:hypothetical protein
MKPMAVVDLKTNFLEVLDNVRMEQKTGILYVRIKIILALMKSI